jgi:nicotinate dehydrogenase subunit B
MISRRDLLKSGSVLVVSFTFGVERGLAQGTLAQTKGKPVDPHEVDSFLAIHADGSVTVYTGKVDLGTGLRIAVRQMAAEELGLPVERVALVEGDTALTVDQGGTGGSTGLTRGGVEVRQAAATAYQALMKGGKSIALKVDPKVPLKDPAHYTVVGKPIARPDVPAKCTGKHVYVQDFSMPGMLHGRVIRPAAIGAKVISVDESSIQGIPDVRVVRIQNFLGVVAKDEWAAVRAAKELKVVWSEWEGLPGSEGLDRHVRSSAIEKEEQILARGSDRAPAAAVKNFSASYMWPNQSHASLGPSCAVADMRADGLTIWTSSQATHGLRITMGKIFSISPDKIRVVYLDGAGCYGGNGNDDAAADAVLLSKSVSQPVRVQWMRHDEHAWDPKGPQQLLDMRASLDAEGHIASWEADMWLPVSRPGNRPFLAFDAAGIQQDHGQGGGLLSQNADPPYSASHVRVNAHWLKESPLRISNLRAPGKIANVFAAESMADELAVAAGMDAVAWRMRGLTDPRAIEVLERATGMFGWKARTSPNPEKAQGNLSTGRGVAYMRYKQAENYVAMAMEVSVDRTTGRVAVKRVTCAHDCGLVVNPDSLRNQIEGCIIQTLSRTLHEEVKFDRSRVTSVDWASYPILTFPEAPVIEVALIDRPTLPLYGAGEAASAPVAASLANAIFDATGIRLRTVPFTAERVKAALA